MFNPSPRRDADQRVSLLRSAIVLEIAAALVIGVIGAAVARYFDVFEQLEAADLAAGHHRVETGLAGLTITSILLLAFSVRRWFMLRREAQARAASEQRLSALFAASPFPVGLFSLDDGRILDANTMAIRAAGMPREMIIGRSIEELPFWDRAAARDLLSGLRKHGSVRNQEINTRTDSRIRPVLVSAQVVDLDGQRCFLAAMSDISLQRDAERAREESASELRGVFQAMRDVVLVLRRDGKYLKVPPTNSDLLYRPPADLVGRRVHDVLPAEEAAGIVAIIGQSLDQRRAVVTEYPLKIAGREVWFAATVTPLDETSVVWVARDVTDERLARHQLAESEAQYRLLFARNPQPMWVLSDDYRFLDVNDAALHHYGYTREEFLALSPDAIRPSSEVELFHAARHSDWPLSESRLFHHRTRAGNVIDVEISRDNILYHGTPARLILANDVTARLRAARELEASLSLQRATLEATADGIVALDDAGMITSWNGKFLELIGLSPTTRERDTIEASFAEMMGITTERPDAATRPALASDDDTMATLELSDGRIIERYDRPRRIGGEVVGRVCSFRDVTQRDRAIAQRHILAERFQRAFGEAPIGMTIMTTDGRWLQVNRAMCEMLGRSEDELVGRRSDSITHGDDRKRTEDAFLQLRDGERTVRFVKRYRHANGSDIWALVSATMLGSGSETSELIISHVVDITEQRAAESELRRQALVFSTIADAVVICSPDAKIVDSNDAATAILGYSREELLGKTPQLWQRQDVIPPVFEEIRDGLRAAGMWSGEYGFVAKDGRTGVVESTVRILRDSTGKQISSIGVFRDVTEHKEMMRQLVQAQKLEAIGSLAAGIAHEINTPIQYVGDNVRFLGDGIAALGDVLSEARLLADAARTHEGLAERVAEFDGKSFEADADYLLAELPVAARQSREGCDRITDIVKAMKGFSHPGGTQKQLFDLNAAVRDTATVCRNEWKYVAELAMDLDPDLPFVSCFPGELQQVVLNLIVNAAHAIDEAHGKSGELGHITVATSHDDAWAEIRVSDDGCGIPEAIRAKVFDPFFTTKKVGTGTGQGLSIGHASVVRNHAGTLTFETEVGKGTTFIIRLPLDLPAEAAA